LDNGDWYNCNDSHCSKLKGGADNQSASAYVLFYIQQWRYDLELPVGKLWINCNSSFEILNNWMKVIMLIINKTTNNLFHS
jgi:hypothetical protein